MKNILNFLLLCLLLLGGLHDATCNPIKREICATGATFVPLGVAQNYSFLSSATSVTFSANDPSSLVDAQGKVALNAKQHNNPVDAQGKVALNAKQHNNPADAQGKVALNFSEKNTVPVGTFKSTWIMSFSGFPYLPHNYPSGTKSSTVFSVSIQQSGDYIM